MPAKPAARVGDPVTPPHAPPNLVPGPGATTVYIGGSPAWRATVDVHACTTTTPVSHGPEICPLGSLSVMIEKQMAVRQGDLLVGSSAPNAVLVGCESVQIGDMGFGLAAPASMAEYLQDFADFARNWAQLTPEERRHGLEQVINKQLAKSGVPPQRVQGSAAHEPGNAEYDFQVDTLSISQAELEAADMRGAAARELANSLYHEARHAEQWNLMARHAAAEGQSAEQLRQNMGITPQAAESASKAPLDGPSPQSNLGRASYDSVYGDRGQYRNEVLGADGRYDEYRALPEEQDAWNTADDLFPQH